MFADATTATPMRSRTVAVALSAALSGCATTGTVPAARVLASSWRSYTHDYVQADGRVIDASAGQITTSEGQAYAMVRAWWSQDRRTFEAARRWSIDNLQGGDPTALPAWKWGARGDGTWGVVDPNPATDADLWMAWVLLGAAHDWEVPEWRTQALALTARIWDEETTVIAGERVLLPGPWARSEPAVAFNPSYVMPFIFRALAIADRDHDWMGLTRDAYAQLERVFDAYILPPDWCWMDPTTGALVAPPAGAADKLTFGYDAIRLPWILAADATWFRDPRATALLARFDGLLARFHATGRLPATTAQDGTSPAWESRSLYASLLPYMAIKNPADVPKLQARIDDLREHGHVRRGQGREYYAENWVWFGRALLAGIARPVESP